MERVRLSVIGGGAWGTSLADHAAKIGHRVTLWTYEPEVAAAIARTAENPVYLPGLRLHPALAATADLEAAVAGAEWVIFVVPTAFARAQLARLAPLLPAAVPVVSATKGIENGSLQFVTQIMQDVFGARPHPLAVLSGPSFAREVVQGHPTAVVLATADAALGARLQTGLSSSTFRVYTSADVIGVQLGGALKNVMALAAGISDGLGFGHNTRAALIARGLAEIARLGRALGAEPVTLAGLAGLGDLVLTCTGELSRNRAVGLRLGRGERLEAILKDLRGVAEGVETCRAAQALIGRCGVRAPIIAAIHSVLFDGKDARRAVEDLLAIPPAEDWVGP